jgi:putative ABC transport system permease protein
VARLLPSVTLSMANAKLGVVTAEFRRNYPNIMGPQDSFRVEEFQNALVSDVRPSLLVLAGAVGFVLLIACANVANLLLVRATGRKREMAVRVALGAGRARIVRQMLTESVVLSLFGGALGLGLGLSGVKALVALNGAGLPRIGEHGSAIVMDWRVLIFTVLISLASGIVFGLIPASGVSRTDLTIALKEGGRCGTGLRQNRTRSLLVISEVALALVLTMGAALLMRTFFALRLVDAGFSSHNVLTTKMSLAGSRFDNTAQVNRLVLDAVRRMQSLPGVAVAGATYSLPLEGGFGVPFNVAGKPPSNGRYDGRGWIGVSSGYFEVFKIPMLRGRPFNSRDEAGAGLVAIVNQAMVRRFWAHGDPLGDRLILGQGYGPEFAESPRQIVGVVGDVHDLGLNRNPAPMVYVPLGQVTDGITALTSRALPLTWIVRTRVAPRTLLLTIERELREASGGMPLAGVRTMDEVVSDSTARSDFNMILLIVFAGSALALAAIGIYGLMTYSVQQRTQEIGIRLALGAEVSAVRNMIMLQGMRLAGTGVILGVCGSFGLTRLLSSFLFGVKAWDPLVFTVVPLLLAAIGAVSVWLPARRAANIDPLDSFRQP